MHARLPPGTIWRSTLKVSAGGALIFGAKEVLGGEESVTANVTLPVLHALLEPETCHQLAVSAAARGWGFPRSRLSPEQSAVLRSAIPEWGSAAVWDNPLGLAAGFDKDAEAVAEMRERSGFALIEAGTVTPLPQAGNPKPRLFLLPDHCALINRYGFNSSGHGPVLTRVQAEWERLSTASPSLTSPSASSPSSSTSNRVWLGINLGKNKDSVAPHLDYSVGVALFGPYVDYIVINVSSPNTPGLRLLQTKKELKQILATAKEARSRIASRDSNPPKLLLKIAPDLSPEEVAGIADVARDKSLVDGLIVTNTTVARPGGLGSDLGPGGLSGPPLLEPSTRMVGDLYCLTGGRVPIIGAGGVSCGADAYEKIRAGASLVQLYTALVYQGFPVVERIKRELADLLIRDGFSSVQEAVGADFRQPPSR